MRTVIAITLLFTLACAGVDPGNPGAPAERSAAGPVDFEAFPTHFVEIEGSGTRWKRVLDPCDGVAFSVRIERSGAHVVVAQGQDALILDLTSATWEGDRLTSDGTEVFRWTDRANGRGVWQGTDVMEAEAAGGLPTTAPDTSCDEP